MNGGSQEEFASRRAALEDAWRPWQPRTVDSHFEQVAERFPDDAYLISGDTVDSYGSVLRDVRRAAAALAERGVGAGDRVGLLIGNTPDIYVLKLALYRLGAVAVPLNYLLTWRELDGVLSQADLVLVLARQRIAGHDMAALVEAITESRGDLLPIWAFPEVTATAIEGVYRTARPGPAADDRGPEGLAEIIFTSGSTGQPKGVMVTHESLLRNGYGTAYARALPQGTRTLLSLPPFHRFGYGEALLPAMFVGGAVILEETFDPAAHIEQIRRHEATDLVCVARMAKVIMADPRMPPGGFPTLSAIYSGGDVVTESYWLSLRDVLGAREITHAFGVTEHGVSFMACPDDPLENAINSVGKPKMAGIAGIQALGGRQTECLVVDPYSGDEAPLGTAGELRFRGPCVTPGYWRNSDADASVFVDGWQRSGDLGFVRDDGCLVLTGRAVDVYRSGAENVSPSEIEAVLNAMPDVQQAHVVAVPDVDWGAVGCAFVISRPGSMLTVDHVIAHSRAHLARYKVPKHVFFVTESDLPRTSIGKLKRADLAAEAEAAVRASSTSDPPTTDPRPPPDRPGPAIPT